MTFNISKIYIVMIIIALFHFVLAFNVDAYAKDLKHVRAHVKNETVKAKSKDPLLLYSTDISYTSVLHFYDVQTNEEFERGEKANLGISYNVTIKNNNGDEVLTFWCLYSKFHRQEIYIGTQKFKKHTCGWSHGMIHGYDNVPKTFSGMLTINSVTKEGDMTTHYRCSYKAVAADTYACLVYDEYDSYEIGELMASIYLSESYIAKEYKMSITVGGKSLSLHKSRSKGKEVVYFRRIQGVMSVFYDIYKDFAETLYTSDAGFVEMAIADLDGTRF